MCTDLARLTQEEHSPCKSGSSFEVVRKCLRAQGINIYSTLGEVGTAAGIPKEFVQWKGIPWWVIPLHIILK